MSFFDTTTLNLLPSSSTSSQMYEIAYKCTGS